MNCVTLQVFARKLDQLESTVSQLASASNELVNSGFLSDNDDVKQQVQDCFKTALYPLFFFNYC
jgi:hypothetical protein